MVASVFLSQRIPTGKHRIKVATDIQRENQFWQLTTRFKSEWGFDTDPPTVARDVLPMIGVDYRMALSSTNTAPAGKYSFTVAFTMPDTLTTPPAGHHTS